MTENIEHHYNKALKQWIYDFGPAQWVIDDLFTDIAEFMDEPLASTMRKCRMGSNRVGRLWKCEKPETEEERNRFYARTDAHIHEGANWHTDHPQPLRRWNIAQKCKGRVLVYGCGIGTEGLFALYNPNVETVIFYDIPDSLIINFVLRRFANHQSTPERCAFWTVTDAPFNNANDGYDTIICMDVLEHLPDPQAMLNEFGNNLNPDGLLMVDAPFEDTAPVGHIEQHRDLDLDEMIARAGITNYEKDLLR